MRLAPGGQQVGTPQYLDSVYPVKAARLAPRFWDVLSGVDAITVVTWKKCIDNNGVSHAPALIAAEDTKRKKLTSPALIGRTA
jgi:hypothetical protein